LRRGRAAATISGDGPLAATLLEPSETRTIMVGLLHVYGKLDHLIEDVAVIRELLEDDGEEDEDAEDL
jgi:hypothetical protein